MLFARLSKLTPSQYLLQNESLILEPALNAGTSSPSSSSSRHVTASIPPVLVGEAFEIFQPTLTDSSSPSPARHLHHHQQQATSHSVAMGVKEGAHLSVTAKRRFSPESRKENGFEEHHSRTHLHHHHSMTQQQHSEPTAAKRHHASVISPNLVTRSHILLPTTTSTAGPLHPLHSNASLVSATATSATAAGTVTSSSSSGGTTSHQNHMTVRAALMEQAAHEAAAAAIFRVSNGSSSSPSASNGHLARDSLSNGRPSPSVTMDHPHSLQMSERFDRERAYSSSLEKELLSRNVGPHSKMIVSPPSYSADAMRSYSEEVTREAEEEWRNIHTVSSNQVYVQI